MIDSRSISILGKSKSMKIGVTAASLLNATHQTHQCEVSTEYDGQVGTGQEAAGFEDRKTVPLFSCQYKTGT